MTPRTIPSELARDPGCGGQVVDRCRAPGGGPAIRAASVLPQAPLDLNRVGRHEAIDPRGRAVSSLVRTCRTSSGVGGDVAVFVTPSRMSSGYRGERDIQLLGEAVRLHALEVCARRSPGADGASGMLRARAGTGASRPRDVVGSRGIERVPSHERGWSVASGSDAGASR